MVRKERRPRKAKRGRIREEKVQRANGRGSICVAIELSSAVSRAARTGFLRRKQSVPKRKVSLRQRKVNDEIIIRVRSRAVFPKWEFGNDRTSIRFDGFEP